MLRGGDRGTFGFFVMAAVLAGGNAVAIRFSNRELDPLWGAAVRFGAASVILLAFMAVRRLPMPRGRALAGTILFGTLNFGVTFGLAYFALVHIHAGLGQTLLALVPLVTLLLAVAQGLERLRATALGGTVIAVAGVAVVTGATLRESVPPVAMLAVAGAVLAFAQSAVLVRRLPKVAPVTMNAVGMTAAAVLLFAGSLIAGDEWILPERAETWWALLYVVVAGSVLTFVLYLTVIQRWGPSRSAYIFVVIPVVTIILSAWLDDEPLGLSLLLGTPLILTGVYIGALRPAGERHRDDRTGNTT